MKEEATFAARFKELIGDVPYSSLSGRLDVGCSTISTYVNGTSVPRRPTLENIARIYNVNPDWLAGKNVPKRPEITDDQKYLSAVIRTLDADTAHKLRIILDEVLLPLTDGKV